MQPAVDRLIGVLTEEAILFESFLSLLDRQTQALVNNNVDELNEITAAQRSRLSDSAELEKRRKIIVEEISRENPGSTDLTVSALLELVNAEEGRRLSQVRDTILRLNTKIEERRQRNSVLIEKSRELVSETLKLINRLSDTTPENNNYTRTREGNSRKPASRMSLALDKRV